MIASAILWGHALAALAFGALIVATVSPSRRRGIDIPFVVALVATALWALAVAGIDGRDVVARMASALRDTAWLLLMLAIVRRAKVASVPLTAVYAAAWAVGLAAAVLALVQTLPLAADAIAALDQARIVARMLAALICLVLLHNIVLTVLPSEPGRVTPIVIALAAMWGFDLAIGVCSYVTGTWPAMLVAARGFALAAAAVLLAVADRRGERGLAVSHSITLRLFALAALVAYAGVTIALTGFVERWAGSNVRIVQTAIVLGSTTALITLLSTPWLRAWAKVKVAKHFFRHRYDYRAEWQRFTATLGIPGKDADPLDRRIVRAIANLTDSPAGVLLVPDGITLGVGASWNWPEPGEGSAPLSEYLAASGRIIELDEIRRGEGPAEQAASVPAWMLAHDEAWALVPLLHGSDLIGAILLSRPPIDRALDWEDLDLLRVAGRQAASYLAEDRARTALANGERFDEFNRRFAFIIHDIKNLVSGLTLVARNAERHADNPAFRADMIETLKDSAIRMNALLARLSQHHRATPEPLQPVDAAALARVVAARRRQHPVVVTGVGTALAQPGRLEQLLGHLVQNAIEASAEDGAVTIAIAEIDGRVAVDVIDQGCGMSPGFIRDQLFRPFASTKPSGFGIGAYEARELARAMNGSLSVTSREGEGSCFRLLLPIAASLEAAA